MAISNFRNSVRMFTLSTSFSRCGSVRLSNELTPLTDTIVPTTPGKFVRNELGYFARINTGMLQALIERVSRACRRSVIFTHVRALLPTFEHSFDGLTNDTISGTIH